MSARHRWLAVALVVAGAACADIASPLRDDFYEWRLITPAASGTGVDSLSFHWQRNRLPVRVWDGRPPEPAGPAKIRPAHALPKCVVCLPTRR